MARPKSEATRITELKSDLETMTQAYNSASARAREQNEILFSMFLMLSDMRLRWQDNDDGFLDSYLHALHLMAEKGTDI